MSSNNDKRRTSILKKRKSVDDETMEVTVNKIQKKTQFSQKNQVKEFRECSERLTIWGNSYETLDVSKFDTGSYDSNHKSNNDIIQNSKSSQNESEKENIIIHSDVSSRLEQNVSTNSSHNSVELTLFVDSNEEKRMKKYGTENLNITSLAFDTSSSSSKILSPRKMVFNNKSNVSVVIKDKVYIEPSAQENSVSFITEPNECPNSEHEASNKPYALKTNVNKLSITDSNFKPKTVSMPVNKKTHSLLIASPSNKPKDPNDDLFKLIVSDTPSKNLCCLGKSCTPTRSESKVIFTAQRSTSIARKSINLLEEFETIEKNKIEKFTSARKTIFHNDSIQTDKNFNQKIIFGKTHMHLQTDQDKIPSIKIECYDDNEKANDESSELTENNFKKGHMLRKTILHNDSMQIEENSDRKTIHKSIDMQNEMMQRRNQQSQPRKTIVFNDSNDNLDDKSNQSINIECYDDNEKANDELSKLIENNFKKGHMLRKTILHNDSMQIEENSDRKTIHKSIDMQNEMMQRRNQQSQPRKTIVFNDSNDNLDDKSNQSINIECYDDNEKANDESSELTENNFKKGHMLRKTILHNDSMQIEENSDRKTIHKSIDMQNEMMQRRNQQSQPRKTIVFNDSNDNLDDKSNQSINIECSDDNEKANDESSKLIENNFKKGHMLRKTILHNDSMQIEENSDRKTIHKSIDMQNEMMQRRNQQSQPRKTIVFNDSNDNLDDKSNQSINIECYDDNEKANDELSKLIENNFKKGHMLRKTILHNDSMQIEENSDRKTIHKSIDMQNEMMQRRNQQSQPRKTIVFNDSNDKLDDKSNQSINIECYDDNEKANDESSELTENNFKKGHMLRKTILHNDSMQIEENSDRKTIHKSIDMQNEMMQRRNQQSQPRKTIVFNDSNDNLDDKSNQSINIECYDDNEKANDELSKLIENNFKKGHMLRKTILHNDSMQIEENSDRKTIHKSIDMQTEMMQSNQQLCKTIMFNDSSHNINYRNQQENESHLFEIDRRRTYTKEESVKWHNITDKEMMYNMIDDESNPCLDSLDNQEMLQRVSSEHSAMVIYEHAVEDFVNLTIVESPLNNTFSQSRMSQSNIQRRQSRIPSPVNNLISMFDNLTRSLKKKDSPKPRLEIDDYLEKMKIGQVKIPRYPQNNAKYMTDCVEKKFQKYKEHCDKISKASNSYSVKIFPEIPSAKFLMKNLIDTMEEDMMKMISISKSSVTPVFPESMDFEILLRNKFDTDETLSEFWNLDTLFWWKKCFKLTHWKMPMFTINFTCQQSNEEVNECTIPIIFKDVRLYLNAEYQLKSNESKRNLLLRHEFKKATNMTENFTSMCSSSKDLFSFLNIYHEHVMKVVHLVDNFFKILFKYEAVYFQQPQNLIKKVCFFENEKEVLNLQVSIDDFLEKISVKNLCLKGKRFTYCIQPRNDFKEIRGLMFLEQLLFNTEKFLHINTIRSVIE